MAHDDQNQDARLPSQVAIDSYGDFGFRFAEMSHRGSLMCLRSGTYAWDPVDPAALAVEDFGRLFDEAAAHEFLILGTGDSQLFPSVEVRRAFDQADLGLEPMDTGAACRTYNVLLAEGRAVAAAFVAVE